MSTAHETIAQLTGNLQFLVDNSGLHAFQNSLNAISKQMTAIGRQADKLADKLGMKPKDATQKLDTSLEQSKGRALKLEAELSKAQRATFQAEMQAGKLRYAGHKEEAFLSTQSLKQQQLKAVLEAKAASAEQAHLKTQGIALKNEQSVEAAKARQSRWAEVLRQQQQKTLILQEKQLQSLSGTQRAELALQQARERGQRATERYQQRVADSKAREYRSDERHQQQATKFQGWQARQSVWQARQDTPAPVEHGMSGMDVVGVMSGVAAAVYALSKAASMLSERVEKRQESTSDTQQFSFAEMAVSEDPEKRKKLNAAYIRDSKEYGMAVNKDTAREYSNTAAGLMNHGYDDDQAATTLHNRMAVFRAANLDPTSAGRVNYQMSHVVAKGYASGIDFKALTNNLGAKLAGDVAIGAAHFLGYKGKDEGAQAYMLAAQKKRQITPKALDAGFAYTAVKNKDIVERHAGSIEANAQNLETDKYLQKVEQQKDPELVGVIGERIQAERELLAAMGPVNKTLERFDLALTQLEVGLLRMLVNKNSDGTVKDAAQRAADVGGVGTTEGPAIDPSVMFPPKPSTGEKVTDPVETLFNWITGKKTDGHANNLKVPLPSSSSFDPTLPSLDTSKLDSRQSSKRLEDLMQTPLLQGMARMAVASADNNPQSTGFMSSDAAVYRMQQQPSVTNTTTNNNSTVTNAPVTNVTVNATTNASPEEIAAHAKEAVRGELGTLFNATTVGIGAQAQ